jgi:ACS family tartrate transporter-like MFS transporter
MRLMPVLIIFYILAYVGRSNLGYAALTMNVDLGITDTVFGLLAGIFFLGYVIFEVPSNILMDKFGARIWIARILITWGIIIVLTGFVQNVPQLFAARLLLGLAEAGFFPGAILYLSRWYLGRDAAKAVSMFMLAIPFSYMIGAPISGWIVENIFWFGIPSWRWIFILEGIPSIIGGIACLFVLPNAIKDVKWLDPVEKNWLQTSLDVEARLKPVKSKKHLSKEAFLNPAVWILILVYFACQMGEYGLGFWTPQIIDRIGENLTPTQVGWLTAATYVLGAVTMVLWGRSSDKRRERRWHNIIPFVACAIVMVFIGQFAESMIAILFLALIVGAVYAMFGPFWSLQTYYLTGATAAVGIALINSFGNVAGFASPYLIGAMADATGDQFAGFYVIAVIMLAAAVVLFFSVNNKKLRAQEDKAKIEADALMEAILAEQAAAQSGAPKETDQ